MNFILRTKYVIQSGQSTHLEAKFKLANYTKYPLILLYLNDQEAAFGNGYALYLLGWMIQVSEIKRIVKL